MASKRASTTDSRQQAVGVSQHSNPNVVSIHLSDRVCIYVNSFRGVTYCHFRDVRKSKSVSLTLTDLKALFEKKSDLSEATKRVQRHAAAMENNTMNDVDKRPSKGANDAQRLKKHGGTQPIGKDQRRQYRHKAEKSARLARDWDRRSSPEQSGQSEGEDDENTSLFHDDDDERT